MFKDATSFDQDLSKWVIKDSFVTNRFVDVFNLKDESKLPKIIQLIKSGTEKIGKMEVLEVDKIVFNEGYSYFPSFAYFNSGIWSNFESILDLIKELWVNDKKIFEKGKYKIEPISIKQDDFSMNLSELLPNKMKTLLEKEKYDTLVLLKKDHTTVLALIKKEL